MTFNFLELDTIFQTKPKCSPFMQFLNKYKVFVEMCMLKEYFTNTVFIVILQICIASFIVFDITHFSPDPLIFVIKMHHSLLLLQRIVV